MPTAVLNPQFFRDHAPNVQFFQKWKSTSNWGPQILPIYEWQGILYIATVATKGEATEDFTQLELSIPHVFVGTEAEALQKLWQSWQTEIDSKAMSELGQTLNIQQDTVASKTPASGDFSIDDLEAQFEIDSDEKTKTSQELENSEELVFEVDEPAVAELDNHTPIPSTSLDAVAVPEPALPTKPAPKPTALPQPTAATAFTGLPSSPATPAATVTSPALPAASPTVLDIFNSMTAAHFQQSMILLVQGEIAKPWKWTENVKNSPQKIRIELTQFSPFRVVHRTHKTFFGKFKANPAVEQMAKVYFEGKAPEHLTLVPIMNGDKLIALLLGVLDKEIIHLPESRSSLHQAEKIADSASKMFASNPAFLQAA